MCTSKLGNVTLIAFIFFVFPSSLWAGEIIRPWRATTAIVKAGQSFEVWFVAESGQTVDSVELRSPYLTIDTTISTQTGDWVYDQLSGNRYNTLVSVTVPADVPEDRYELVLNTSTGDEESSGAVKVVKEFRAEYYVVHISDAHRWQGGYDGMLILRKVSAVVDIANIIDAQIIIETGDNMYSVRNHPEREESYFQGVPSEGILGMHDAFAATFMCPGNHDTPSNNISLDTIEESADFYNTYYGLQFYNFSYGNGRYIVFNNAWGAGAVDFTSRANEAAAWLDTAGRGNLVVGAGHCRDTSMEPYHNVLDFDQYLAGHSHGAASENPQNVDGEAIGYVANDMRSDNRFEFLLFRVNNNTGTFTPVSDSTARVYVLQSTSEAIISDPNLWERNLTLTFARENDGTAETNTAVIDSYFDFPIHDARIRFVMPQECNYEVTSGTITQQFEGDEYCIVDVAVDVPDQTEVSVEINRSDDPPDTTPDGSVSPDADAAQDASPPADTSPIPPSSFTESGCGCEVTEGTGSSLGSIGLSLLILLILGFRSLKA